MARKTRPTPIHTGFCRFTERSVEVFKHGHGIKLSIRTSDAEGDVVSVFLDVGATDDLAQAIGGTGETERGRTHQLESVLMQLASTLNRAGY